jgi:malate synthase
MRAIAGRHADYRINPQFGEFIETEVLPLGNHSAETFWRGLGQLLDDFASPQVPGAPRSQRDQQPSCATDQADADSLFGPHLEAPLNDARIALNATNARWGSLYDALYSSQMIPHHKGLRTSARYNPARGSRVISYARDFLDATFALDEGSHHDVTGYMVYFQNLMAVLADGTTTGLANPKQFVALAGPRDNPCSIVLKNHDLHVELQFDRNGNVGSRDLAGLQDIQIEAAITTVLDCQNHGEDPAGKIEVYRNWLGLMRGDLSTTFAKSGQTITRRSQPDRLMTGRDGEDYRLRGRSLLMVRNAAMHAPTAAVEDHSGKLAAEGILDAVLTAMIGALDLQQRANANSRNGSVYIIAAQADSREAIERTCELFDSVESLLGMPAQTLKLAIDDKQAQRLANQPLVDHDARIVRAERAVARSQSGAVADSCRQGAPSPTPSAAVLQALQFHHAYSNADRNAALV